MDANAFYTLADMPYDVLGARQPRPVGLTTLKFPCDAAVVGALVGRKWSRVKGLSSDFRVAFPGYDIDVTYDGECFTVLVPNMEGATAFIEDSFGEEVAIANHGIEVRPEFVGRLIGRGGHNLRTIAACIAQLDECKGCASTVYHEDGRFWIRFSPSTPVQQRKVALEFVETRLYEHADYLEEQLTEPDTATSETSSGWSSTSSEAQSVASSTSSEAQSVASSEFTDDGDWPELCA